jgi:hypothetical protein
MKKRSKLLTLILTLFLCMQIFSVTSFAASETIQTTEPTVTTSSGLWINTCSDHIEWRIKVVNGKYYRRLYNYTKCEWIGDWILIG